MAGASLYILMAKLTSIVEKATVSVGNESSTAPLVMDALSYYKISLCRAFIVMKT